MYAVALLAALITALVYIPALQNGFVIWWDDNKYVNNNGNIYHIDLAFIKWAFTAFHVSNWHPLTWVSHALDYALWGLNPMGHHLTSILLHGINTFLVVLLIFRLVDYAQDSASSSYALITATVTGLLFGVHPLHVESVAWVSERKDVLYACFYLLSVLAYLKYAVAKRGNHYVLCLFFFVLSLLSKPMAVTLPVVLLILDVYPLKRLTLRTALTSGRKVLMEKLPFVLLSLGSSVLTIMAQQGAMASLQALPLMRRFLGALWALIFYLFKMLWPAGLSPLYPSPSHMSLFTVEYMGALAAVVCITVFCLWMWRRQKVFGAAWVYYIVTLLPVLGIIQVGQQAAADRYTYLPGLGPMVLVGIGISRLWAAGEGRSNRLMLKKSSVIIMSAFIMSLFVFLTVKQIAIWNDSLSLWNAELKFYPKSPDAYCNRGMTFYALGNFKRAIEDFNKAIEIDPHSKCYSERGLVHLMSGQSGKAIADFDKSIALYPQHKQAYYDRIRAYNFAISEYSKAIALDPKNSELYINRGAAFAITGYYNFAIEDLTKAISLNPRHVTAYYNRGLSYRDSGNDENALRDFQSAARLGDKEAQDYLLSKGIGW